MGDFRSLVPLTALGALLMSGCVNVYPPQFPENHPANVNAPQTPLVIRSRIEPYRPAEVAATGEGAGTSDMGGMKGMDHSGMGHSAQPQAGAPDRATPPSGDMRGMDHSQHGQAASSGMSAEKNKPQADHGMAHGDGAHGTAAGRPGSAGRASRTIRVTALDTMRFDPQTIRVKAGETIRFVVTNKGKLPHEFVIGTPQEQKQHAEMMQKMPGMEHADDENALTLAPGETKTLVWQFGQIDVAEIGCHEPGHYPAGMVAKVIVGADGRASAKEARPKTSGDASGRDHSQHQHGK